MLKSQIHYDERVFSIQFQLPSLFTANIDKLKSSILGNLINQRNDNYVNIDKKTQLNYFVTFSRECISFNFDKSKLVNYDIDILIKSLSEKLFYQHACIEILFSTINKINYSIINEIEYSPTELSIEIIYGKMMIVQFQISAFIFNPLIELPSNKNPTKVCVTNQTFQDSNCKIQNIFKNHPINLGIASTFQIDQFVEYLHKTYIPMQILTYRLTDISLISQISQYMLTLHPTKSLAILVVAPNQEKIPVWFGSEPLIISMNSYFKNNSLHLELDSGTVYHTLQGLSKNSDFPQFNTYIKKVITKWEFQALNEVDDFFNKFLLYLFSYFLLSASKGNFLNLLYNVSYERIERTLRALIQKAANLLINQFSRIQEKGEYKKNFNNFIERNIKLNEIVQIEQRGTYIGEIVQCFLEKQEKNFQELTKQQLKDDDFSNFVQRYNFISSNNQGAFQVNLRQKRYLFFTLDKKIQKHQDDMPIQTWTYEQFPESELKIIKDEV